MEVSAVRSAVLRDRNFSSTGSSGSKGPLWSPARTIERSQEGTRGDLEGFILLAPFRNLTMRSCFPRYRPSTASWWATIVATYTFKVEGDSLRSNLSCRKESTTPIVHLWGSSRWMPPDNIPGRVLKDCAEQLTDVRTDIFNTSLSQAVIPTCLKSTTIIPVPKKSPVSCLNDYRLIALTPIIMKCFERLVMHNIKTSLPNSFDPLQFAYRPNRSTDDAISSTLHLALTHLENKDSYVRMLFIDFSSAFNTIIPQQLINKLSLLGLNNSLCNWILDFLTERPQSVRVGHNTLSTTTLSTGAPQGCVLSPLLFTLLTHDCTAKFSSNHIIKFADDTSVVGLISNNDETHYREEVAQLAEWCGANNLSLNVEKTKEVVMDFRRNPVDHPPLTIGSSTVERVSSTKFLGVHITEDLTWSSNTMSVSKKAQQCLHFPCRLKRASLPPPILTTFYRGTIESVLTSCITVWYGNFCGADRKTLQRTVNLGTMK